jgi:hypothetical protein
MIREAFIVMGFFIEMAVQKMLGFAVAEHVPI